MTIIIGILCFIYILYRFNTLEEKIQNITNNQNNYQPERKATPLSATSTPGAQAKPAPQIASVIPAAPTTVAAHAPTPIAKPISAQTGEKDESHGEFKFGAQVLTTIGIVAVLLGVIFFLRYAFDTGLINETMRIFLGFLLGIIFVITGHLLRKRFATYGTGLVGGGLGIFYVTTYAAFVFYGFLGEPAAFGLFIAITAVGAGLAIVYNSMPLILFSLLGGFIVPFLFPMTKDIHVFFPYLIVLNLAILLIARFKAWPKLTVVGLVATWLLTLEWVLDPIAQLTIVQSFVYVTILFLIYFTTSFINFIVRDRDYKGIDAFLVYALPAFYFILTSPLIETRNGYAIFTLVLGLFYIVTSIVLRVLFKDAPAMAKCSNIMLVIGSIYIVIATALHFDGHILTILLAAEALFMIMSGIIVQTPGTRMLGLTLAALTGIITLTTGFGIEPGSTPIFNERTFTVGFVALIFAIIWYMYKFYLPKKAEANVKADELGTGRYLGALGLIILAFLWISIEPLRLLSGEPARYFPIAWALFALIFTAVSFLTREFIFRVISYIALGLGTLTLIVDNWSIGEHAFLFNIRVLSVLIVAAVMSIIIAMMKIYREQLQADPGKVFAISYLVMNGLLLWAGSLEIIDYYNMRMNAIGAAGGFNDANYLSLENTKRVLLSLFWLAYASLGLTYGIVRKSSLVRIFAIVLLSITIFKIFIYDTANLSDIYRFISFISLGIILLLVGFAYYRFKDRIIGLVK